MAWEDDNLLKKKKQTLSSSSTNGPIHVVLDMGAVYTRLGIAGEDMPRVILPSIVTHQLQLEAMDPETGPLRRTALLGLPLYVCRPWEFSRVTTISHPLKDMDKYGVLCDWEGVGLLFESALSRVSLDIFVVSAPTSQPPLSSLQ